MTTMLQTLRIENFRGLREFAMTGLGRVNLLVGTNNCGKTTVLEAIHLLVSTLDPSPIWSSQQRRGETFETSTEPEMDVAHLITGHRLASGARFEIQSDAQHVRASVEDEKQSLSQLLQLEWSASNLALLLPITRRGGLRNDPVLVDPGDLERRVHRREIEAVARPPIVSIGSDGLARDIVMTMFEDIVLTPDEDIAVRALRTIEPTIERIASIGTPPAGARGGLAMMIDGQRVPVGSMGDGIWRLLGIALAIIRCKGGLLLVDEIDTGLHYSVMVDMWKLVLATARSLDVQVFATTHSRDCYEALAAVTQDDRHEISLQRIERGKTRAIGFSEAEIRQAAERGLEVR